MSVTTAMLLAGCGGSREQSGSDCELAPAVHPAPLQTVSTSPLRSPGRAVAAFRVPKDSEVFPTGTDGDVLFAEPGQPDRIGLASASGEVRWEKTGEDYAGLSIQVLHDGNVVVTNSDGGVVLLRGSTGAALQRCGNVGDAEYDTPLLDDDTAVYTPPVSHGTTLQRLAAAGTSSLHLPGFRISVLASTGGLAVLGPNLDNPDNSSDTAVFNRIRWIRNQTPLPFHRFRGPIATFHERRWWDGQQVLGVTPGGLTIVQDLFDQPPADSSDPSPGGIAAIRTDGSIAWRTNIPAGANHTPAQTKLTGDRVDILHVDNGAYRLDELDDATGQRRATYRVPDGDAPIAAVNLSTAGAAAAPARWIWTPQLIADPPRPHSLTVPGNSDLQALDLSAASPNTAAIVHQPSNAYIAYELRP